MAKKPRKSPKAPRKAKAEAPTVNPRAIGERQLLALGRRAPDLRPGHTH